MPAVRTACIVPIVAIATIGIAAVPVARAKQFTGTNGSSPPRSALVVEGRSMAGAELASKAPKNELGDRILAGVLARWGPVDGPGSCFEGSNCSWNVRGQQTVLVVLHPVNERIKTIATDVSRWRTAGGIGRGSTVDALKRTYRQRIAPRTTCGLNGFGGANVGYVLNTRVGGERRFTFFELSASRRRVDTVWIGRGRASPGSRC